MEMPTINWKKVCFFSFFICLAMLIFYVFEINSLTSGYYLVSGYQKQIVQLSQENKNLEVSFAESSFLGQALEKIHAMNFQKTTSVRYLQIDASEKITAINKK